MNKPSPALVTQRSVQQLPRWMLLLLCAAYVVPGVFGRDPWRNQDLASYGVMSAIAQGRVDWLHPTLGGLPVASEPLPYWLGATAIWLLSPLMDAAVAARLPFAALLALTLAFTWYACFHLARTEAAQPVAFAFGGEADPVDYARAMADGSVLALMASLGLLQLGHETTPELMQLFGISLTLWALSAAPFRQLSARIGIVVGLLVLAASGAPTVALLAGFAGWVICLNSSYEPAKRFAVWPLLALLLAALCGGLLDSWAWRWAFEPDAANLLRLGRLWIWFLWPAWLFAAWTLWRWRRHWRSRHVTIPSALVAIAWATSTFMGGSDRALMLVLPGMAVLAAFALPTMRRSVTAAIDWFTVFAATATALFVWAMYLAMHTGWPAIWKSNINRLQPGVESSFEAWQLVVGLLGTTAWVLLVRWRTGRNSTQALWKTLVLPASGVALCWLLVMSLWLPRLDYARSARPLIERGLIALRAGDCISAPDTAPALIAALEIYAQRRVVADPSADPRSCQVQVVFSRVPSAQALAGWRIVAAERRNRESSELMVVYQRLDIGKQ